MTYDFDIAYDCPVQELFVLLDSFDLKIESWESIGPGGGNPNITISGTPENASTESQRYRAKTDSKTISES